MGGKHGDGAGAAWYADSMTLLALCGAALLVAYSNGANDNFKGFATYWGSGEATYETARIWATLMTIAGALASLYLAEGLVQRFSGKGLVPDELAGTAPFVAAVAWGAGLTVLLATRIGFPISTTHAIIGGLVGAGLAAPGHAVGFGQLGRTFVLPLLLSPVLSATIAAGLYALIGRRPGEVVLQAAEVCLCETGTPATADGAAAVAVTPLPGATLTIGTTAACARVGAEPIATVAAAAGLQRLHFLSAATICCARGLNDTPKLVALLLAARLGGIASAFWVVAAAMALGGWLNGRRVADRMSRKIVSLAPAQGLCANLVTAALVLSASWFGLPVSTTHVSVGSIGGTGFVSGRMDTSELGKIVLSWVVTLPCAAVLAAAVMLATSRA